MKDEQTASGAGAASKVPLFGGGGATSSSNLKANTEPAAQEEKKGAEQPGADDQLDLLDVQLSQEACKEVERIVDEYIAGFAQN